MGGLQVARRYITHNELSLAIIGFGFEHGLEGLHGDEELFPHTPRDDPSIADLEGQGA
jgi:hypothetical protein